MRALALATSVTVQSSDSEPRERPAELVDQVETRQGRRRQDDDVRASDGLLESGRGDVDRAVGEGLLDGRRAATPRRHVPLPGLRPLVQGAGDGTADQAETGDGDSHAAHYGRAHCRQLRLGCRDAR